MDLKEIKLLIRLLQESDLSEIEFEEKGRRVRVRRERITIAPQVAVGEPIVLAHAQTTPGLTSAEVVEKNDQHFAVIPSPIVGTFYRTHAPGADPYVEVGSSVKKGQTLCIVEAMKLMNEIESDMDGTVVAICVEDRSPVEFGQPLFKIEPLK
jgi:acetyl-CoA carboxylase biotin carboxyl carrier protein